MLANTTNQAEFSSGASNPRETRKVTQRDHNQSSRMVAEWSHVSSARYRTNHKMTLDMLLSVADGSRARYWRRPNSPFLITQHVRCGQRRRRLMFGGTALPWGRRLDHTAALLTGVGPLSWKRMAMGWRHLFGSLKECKGKTTSAITMEPFGNLNEGKHENNKMKHEEC